jgi:hypothetical protein
MNNNNFGEPNMNNDKLYLELFKDGSLSVIEVSARGFLSETNKTKFSPSRVQLNWFVEDNALYKRDYRYGNHHMVEQFDSEEEAYEELYKILLGIATELEFADKEFQWDGGVVRGVYETREEAEAMVRDYEENL